MAFAGLRGSGSWGTSERPQNFREMILWMEPNGTAPLFALTSKARKQSTNDPQFHWWEETNSITRLQLNDGDNMSNSDTTVVVNSGALALAPGDILQVEKTQATSYDNELVRVASVTNDTTFVVTRGFAGSTAATINDDSWFTKIGSAHGEGTTAPDTSSRNPTKLTNYTQIFKTPYKITKTALETYFRTGDPKKNEQKRKSFDHAEKIEQSLLFGKAWEGTDSNGMPFRSMGGLREFITTNVTVFAATLTTNSFMDAVYPVFDYSGEGAGDERIAFCGNGALNVLNKAINTDSGTQINFDKVIEFYGMRFNRFIMPQGVLNIKTHPLMNVHPVYTNSMFIINPAGLIYRPLRNRDTKMEKNIQAPDADYIMDQWLTECGFEIHHEKTMAFLTNMNVVA